MTERVLIKDLAAREDGTVRVSGWVEKVRDQRYVQFVVLRDESGAVQLVNGGVLREPDPENPRSDILVPRTQTISELTHGTFITVTGELQHNERVKLGGVEIQIETIEVVTKALPDNPIAADSGIDVRLDWRFLDLRRPEQNLIFRIQTTFLHALRQVWVDRGFIEIQTPKLMASASESRAELFEVEYFEGQAFLAQSPQFFKQMAQAAGFGGIFEVGPAFRADPSFTSRHATEFTSIDTEISWIDSHEDVMELHEELVVAGLSAVKDKHGEEIQKLFGIELEVPSRPFPRIPLAEAKEIVKAEGYEVPRADADMDPEGERRIAAHVKQKYGHDFVFLTDYDASIRPFYHMRDAENPQLTKSYDLIYRGTEISTGAQREHRIEVLEAQAVEKGMDPAELSFYLDFFRYGVPPHGGFGMGLGRVLMLMLQQSSIREVTYLFRGPNRLLP
ncbi:aspartate--tRNA(Asn) ligase [Leucobacter celer]|uniref:aspartate--tRNA(Asn) ligase n=1 Tax=Leucobacter celer TaxID=668625 RepID=UPI000A8BD630|nr:aspartate--tRNA(Asn) ligase [Leucobacter celer]